MEWMEKGCAAVGRAALWGNVFGCVLLGGMALLVTADVVMRGFGASLSGVFEVVEVLMGALVGCGLAYTGVTHSHLEVEILTDMMPRRVRHALGALGALLECAFCAAVGWETADYAVDAFANGECTPTTSLQTWPFIGLLGAGFFLLAVVSLIHMREHLRERRRHDA